MRKHIVAVCAVKREVIGVQARAGIEVRAFGEDDIPSGREHGVGGNLVLAVVALGVAQAPSAEIDRAGSRVEEFDAVIQRCIGVAEDFVDDHPQWFGT